jgi:hypothetical protein
MGVASNLSSGLRLIGIDFGRLSRTLLNLPRYWGDMARYRSCTPQRFPMRLRYLKPMLLDYASQAGVADGHYFFQDLWPLKKSLPPVRIGILTLGRGSTVLWPT